MAGAVPAQVVDAAGRRVDGGLARLFLAVQQPQGVRLEPPPAVLVHQPVLPRLEVGPECVDVCGTAGGVADAVEQQRQVGQTSALQQIPAELDDLGVYGRVAVADGLGPELVQLPVAACLGPVVPIHGADVVEPDRLGPVVHPVLEVGAADRGRALGTQGQEVAAPVLEGVGLLLDYVGGLSDTPDEQPSVLEGRRVDPVVSEGIGGARCRALDEPPIRLGLREQVGGAAWRLECPVSHGAGCSGTGIIRTTRVAHRQQIAASLRSGSSHRCCGLRLFAVLQARHQT